VRGLLGRVAVDVSALRESRDYRVLVGGQLLSGLGTAAVLVALPYQLFVLTGSPALVGLLGAAELGPMVIVSLLGGAIADRMDRRTLLLVAQAGIIATAMGLAAATWAGRPPTLLIFVLGGLLAGGSALDLVTRSAIIPGLAGPNLRAAVSFNFGLYQLTGIVGPAIGGVLIASVGVGATYAVDAGSCLAMALAVLAIPPQHPPAIVGERPRVASSIAEGLRFVRANHALMGSFAIDLVAMTFGMPRALFAVLSLTVYHAGAEGAGAMYAAVSAGAAVAALTTGWLTHARRLGRIVIVAVVVWGLAIAGAGAVGSLLPALVLLAAAGAADSVSAVCRSTINQTVTPEHMRGRMSSVFSLVVTSGPRLGDIESGTVASLSSARVSVLSGGLACVAGVGLIMLAFPALAAYDSHAGAPGEPVPATV
jgi:MFS family permease